MEVLVFSWLVGGVVFGLAGGYVSGQKRRPYGEGFLFGLLLGPIGLLIAALLPTVKRTTPEKVEPVREPTRPDTIVCHVCGHENPGSERNCAGKRCGAYLRGAHV